jgi:hypothetical protein
MKPPQSVLKDRRNLERHAGIDPMPSKKSPVSSISFSWYFQLPAPARSEPQRPCDESDRIGCAVIIFIRRKIGLKPRIPFAAGAPHIRAWYLFRCLPSHIATCTLSTPYNLCPWKPGEQWNISLISIEALRRIERNPHKKKAHGLRQN